MTERSAPGARSFNTVLAELEDGRTHHDLTEELKDLVMELEAASLRKGGAAVKGSITLKISITAQQGVVEVIPDVTVKAPKQPRARNIFWRGKDGTLVRNDPNQEELPLRDVNAATGPVRTVL